MIIGHSLKAKIVLGVSLIFGFFLGKPWIEAMQEHPDNSRYATAHFQEAKKALIASLPEVEARPAVKTSKKLAKVEVPAPETEAAVLPVSADEMPPPEIVDNETKAKNPRRRQNLQTLNRLAEIKVAQDKDLIFVGTNEQGLEQYEVQTENGEHLLQWKKGSELLVEEIKLANGDKLVRRYPNSVDNDDKVLPEIIYSSKDGHSLSGVYYDRSGNPTSSFVQIGRNRTSYHYDNQGRIIHEENTSETSPN